MLKKLALLWIASIAIFLWWCGSKSTQVNLPIEGTKLQISLPQNYQSIPSSLLSGESGFVVQKWIKIEEGQICTIGKTTFEQNYGEKLPMQYIKSLQEFFPGFSLSTLKTKQIKCGAQTYNITFAQFIVPKDAQSSYTFYQALIPQGKTLIVVSCQSYQPLKDLQNIVYSIKCLNNE